MISEFKASLVYRAQDGQGYTKRTLSQKKTAEQNKKTNRKEEWRGKGEKNLSGGTFNVLRL